MILFKKFTFAGIFSVLGAFDLYFKNKLSGKKFFCHHKFILLPTIFPIPPQPSLEVSRPKVI
jgi:hypothetical protein